MSSKPADDDHPYGHARFEYISSLLVACMIFMVGVQFFSNSLQRTISPQTTEFNLIIGVLLIVSIIAKLWQGYFYKTVADKISSKVLLAASVDSRNDVVITTVVLVSAVLEHYTGWLLDGPIGIIVSIFVIISAIELLRETFTLLLGAAPKKEFLKELKSSIKIYPSVLDVHDLIVHSYGEDNVFATAHVEMPASQNILVSHEIIDEMERDFLKDKNIHLVVHLDPVITDDPELDRLEDVVKGITKEINKSLSIHDFRLINGKNYRRLVFDVTVPECCTLADKDIRHSYNNLISKLEKELEIVVKIDRNYISTVL